MMNTDHTYLEIPDYLVEKLDRKVDVFVDKCAPLGFRQGCGYGQEATTSSVNSRF